MNLAEAFGDTSALVEPIVHTGSEEPQNQNEDQRFAHNLPGGISDVVVNDTGQCAQEFSLYFRLGESWADAPFSRRIFVGQPGALLAMRKLQKFIHAYANIRLTRDYYDVMLDKRDCW